MPVYPSTISIETAIATFYQNLLFSDWDWEKFHNLPEIIEMAIVVLL
jgi:hypothetical protein